MTCLIAVCALLQWSRTEPQWLQNKPGISLTDGLSIPSHTLLASMPSKPSAFSSVCDERGSNCCTGVFRISFLPAPVTSIPKASGPLPICKGERHACACVCKLTRECTSFSKCIAFKKKENAPYASVFKIIFISQYLQRCWESLFEDIFVVN